MNWLKEMNNALEYIENHITEDIKLETVAEQAYSSYFHFTRMFYILSGINLGEYIRNRRLTLAASDLVTSNQKVIDVAYKYHYNTPESFSKAFKRFHGVSPKEAKHKRATLRIFPKMSFRIHVEGDSIMDYKIVELDNLNFVGVEKEFTTKDGQNFKEIPLMWNEVMTNGVFQQLIPHAGDMGILGLCYDWNSEQETFKYMIGVRTNDTIEGFKSVEFKKETFAQFKAVGAMPDALQNMIKGVFGEWLPSSNYQHTGGPEIEVYTMGDGSKEDYVSYYMVPIQKK